jgi:preprotein translocase subunit SecE
VAVYANRRTEPTYEFGPVRFLREVFEELRKVVWPTPAELYRYTIVVVVTVVVIAGFIGMVDWGLTEIVRKFIYNAVTSGAPAPHKGP